MVALLQTEIGSRVIYLAGNSEVPRVNLVRPRAGREDYWCNQRDQDRPMP